MAVLSPSLQPLFLLLLIASSSCDLLSPPGVNDEVLALVAMKSLLEDPHGVLRNWDPDSVDPCSWTSITCSQNNLVTRLEAPSQNLSGRLSPSIGNLTNLESLLGRLRRLNLSSNHLYGEIPSSVFHLESLRYLDLSNNNLSGPIPRSFAGTPYVVGSPLICSDNTGQQCSASRAAVKTKTHKFVVAFGSTVASIIFLFLPIS